MIHGNNLAKVIKFPVKPLSSVRLVLRFCPNTYGAILIKRFVC